MTIRTARRDPGDARSTSERRADLKLFADAVIRAAASAPERYRFGRRKVFIAAIEPSRAMRRLLVEAHREGLLTLSRADLTLIPAMDQALVRASETPYMNGVFHLIVLPDERSRR